MKYITTADFIKQLLDHTASRTWEEIAPMEWTTAEMVDQVADLLLMQEDPTLDEAKAENLANAIDTASLINLALKKLAEVKSNAAVEHHGEFANLNVIEGGEE